jgi:tRNA threonylcarbamoyladenosine biosynthesis protein TsaE
LCGTLGAGKTRLVQALAEACGIDRRDVVSPTFVLCQTHVGRRTLHHLDAYRVRDDDEFLELGVSEMFGREALSIVEWGDRVERCLPEDAVTIHVEVTGETERRFVIETPGTGEFDALSRLL